jgi:hypothetical protein
MPDTIVHLMMFGHTACLLNGPPATWPTHHKWSSWWTEVTCPACLAGKDIATTFEISADGKSITCLRCKNTSFHPKDVEHHYCGACNVSHDDIWPPARRAWLVPQPVRPGWEGHEVSWSKGTHVTLQGKHCNITIEGRPGYCDRGNYLAKLHVGDPRRCHVDEADLWPRFYFDLGRAMLECEAWMNKRGELKQ